MVAEILSVGTEILLGTIINTNAAFIAQELAKLGIAVFSQTTVGDNHGRLIAALDAAFEKADMVIAIGGLGPTQDDITKSVAAEYFGLEMVMHEESHKRIQERFAGRPLPENVERNALVPANALIFPNDNGSAPGVCLEGFPVYTPNDKKILIMLPGPPHEMEPMFTKYTVPFLRQKTDGVFLSHTLKVIGLGETKVEHLLRDLIEGQTNPTIAPYAKVGEVHVRLTASAEDEAAAVRLIAPLSAEIYSRLHPYIYGEDEETLPSVVINLLKSKGLWVSVAESCTGGLIASSLVGVPGCSDVFGEGIVAYSNSIKHFRLGVDPDLIDAHGAVSEQVAAAMAEGLVNNGDGASSIGLSTTGIAGPGGGTPEKPVGLVYVGLHIAGRGTQVAKFNLIGNRNEIRTRAAKLSLDMLRRALDDERLTMSGGAFK